MKKILKLVKRIVISAFLLYSYNLIVGPLDLMIPINIVTVSVLTIFGYPALLSFIAILVLLF